MLANLTAKFWKEHKFYCQVCKKRCLVTMSDKNAMLSCSCDDNHTKFLWWEGQHLWLIWEKDKIVMHNGVQVAYGDWRVATEADKPPILRKTFVFR